MTVGKKLAVVLSVIIVGVSAALMFSKENSPLRFWGRASDDLFAQHVERRVGAPAWSPTATAPLGPATAAITQPATAAAPEPMPYQTMRPVGTLLAPIEGIIETEPSAAPPALVSPSVYEEPREQRHVVADGDTLTKLALRYLGRAEAYRKIYEWNRDVLSTPDLLPIGAVLRIPPRESNVTRVDPAPDMAPVPPRP